MHRYGRGKSDGAAYQVTPTTREGSRSHGPYAADHSVHGYPAVLSTAPLRRGSQMFSRETRSGTCRDTASVPTFSGDGVVAVP